MSEAEALPQLLKHTRTERRLSQLELSLRLGVSQRHVSYLELGRAKPSKLLLLAWMRECEAPASIRNAALMQGGFASAVEERVAPVEIPESVRLATRQVLAAHEPLPAVIFTIDRYVTDTNEGARRLWTLLMPRYWQAVQASGEHMDMIESLIDPDGFLSCMESPASTAISFLALLHREVWVRPALAPRVAAYREFVEKRFGVVDVALSDEVGNPQCVFNFRTSRGPLSFILVQSIVGLPQDITIETPRLELWFPADQQTRECVQQINRS